jgi:hypothetical protein
MISSTQANAIRNNLATILQYHRRDDATQSGSPLPDEVVMEIFRESPKVINLIVHLLTDAQVEMIRKATMEDADE